MNKVTVYASYIDNKDHPDKYYYLLEYMPDDKRELITKGVNYQDKLRYLKSEWLIRSIIKKYYNINFPDIKFTYNAYGKPYYLSVKDFYFNKSHSGQYVVCAISNNEIGIDIEHIKLINFNKISQYFSNEEYVSLENKHINKKLSYFYDLWTLKESFMKMTGKGTAIPLDTFSINIDNSVITVDQNIIEYCYFKQYLINPEYSLSVCSKTNNFADSIIII